MSLDLWETFTERLQGAGYTLDDIAQCSDQVFVSVIKELGGFSALQTAKLQTEMKNRLRTSVSRQNSRPSTPTEKVLAAQIGSGAFCLPVQAGTPEHDSITQKASLFLFNSGVNTPIHSVAKWVDGSAALNHAERLRDMHEPSTTPILRFRWMADEDFLSCVTAGTNLLDDLPSRQDPLCPSGIVLYSERACSKPIARSSARHNVLLAVDTVLGRAKLMDEDDVRRLSGFSRRECCASLLDDGFDSIQVLRSNGTSDTVVIFHPFQAIVRYVIRFEPEEHLVVRAPPQPLDAPQLQSLGKCPAHPQKTLEFWCPEEKKLLCNHCLFHSGYNKKKCLLAEDAAAAEVPNLRAWSRNASTFLRDIRGVEQLFDAAVAELEDDAQQQVHDARTALQSLRKAIDAAEELVVEEITHKTRLEVQKLQHVASSLAHRVSEIDDIHNRSLRILTDTEQQGTAMELLSLVQRAFDRWDVVQVPSYELTVVQTKLLPSPSQIASATHTSLTRKEGSISLPEAIDVNFLQHVN